MKMRTAALVALSALTATLDAHEDHNAEVLEELVVYGRSQELIGSAASASEGMVGYDDLSSKPLLRVGELVESMPGMVATQHSGTGKANQYFLRGFNLDHGTDFSANLEGVPLNMRTHGHGQGYLDLNFLIPELVETTTYRKGPYAASVGDFSSAGSVGFRYYERLDNDTLGLTVGGHGYLRGLATGSRDVGNGVLTAALDAAAYDGPWDLDENSEQYKFYAGYAFGLGEARARITLQGYDSGWDSTDQVPRRAVESGLIGARGFNDPDLGGQTQRHALTGSLDYDTWQATAYLIDYDFTLFSNFTYLLENADDSDEFEQRDARRIFGAHVDGTLERSAFARPLELRWGVELRYDDIDELGLYGTAARQRVSRVREDTVEELSLGAFGEAEFAVSERLRAMLGVRADYYDWDVSAFRAENGGSGNDTLLSPKATIAYRFADGFEGYANWGRGFHSNDVRGTTIAVDPLSGDPIDPVEALVGSEGAEVGVRFENERRFKATLVAFWLQLDSELVFVGDAGSTEINDGSERTGIELSGFWQGNDWLALNAAYTFTNAEFRTDQGGGREIPGAVESTFSLGADAAWDSGWSASAKLRYLGDSPLVEDGSITADESLLVNAGVAWKRERFELRLDAFNLFDTDADDIAYYYASRLPGEAAGGVEDVHFHPLEPRTVRASVNFFLR